VADSRARAPAPAPCPRCHSRDAEPVSFTWWGGFLGPRLFNQVRCRCGASFDGRTGRYNDYRIALWVVATMGLGVMIVLAMLGKL